MRDWNYIENIAEPHYPFWKIQWSNSVSYMDLLDTTCYPDAFYPDTEVESYYVLGNAPNIWNSYDP